MLYLIIFITFNDKTRARNSSARILIDSAWNFLLLLFLIISVSIIYFAIAIHSRQSRSSRRISLIKLYFGSIVIFLLHTVFLIQRL